MAPTLYVQKPYKVHAEQFTVDFASPLLCVCAFPFGESRPHIHTATGAIEPHPGDWIVQEAWTPHAVYVLTDAEFQDRF